MQVIPVINCENFECVKKHLNKTKKLGSDWVHIDVSDGIFGKVVNWQTPRDLLRKESFFNSISRKLFQEEKTAGILNMEIHLMVENPEKVLEEWLKIGAKRIIIHLESMADGWVRIMEKCAEYKAEPMVAIQSETPLDNLKLLLNRYPITSVQFLAVLPGPRGQKLDSVVLEKIKVFRKEFPNIKIEVDGGINLENAKLAKEAGADIITSATYIWENFNHKKAFQKLQNI